MEQFNYKVIELIQIYSMNEEHFFTIKINYEDRSQLFNMKVDATTYQRISKIVEYEKSYKYRLSFRHIQDPYSQKIYSTITRIAGEETLQLVYECTEAYADHLSKLRQLDEAAITKLLLPSPKKLRLFKGNYASYSVRFSILTIMLIFIICLPFSYTHIFSLAASQISEYSYEEELEHERQPSYSLRTEVIAGASDLRDEDVADEHKLIELETVIPLSPIDLIADEAMGGLPSFTVEQSLISHLPEGYVALTFDDGPSRFTKEIIDILLDHQIGATFFFVGVHIETYPEMLMYAHEQGMSIANHSWKHDMLTRNSAASQENDITSTNQLIEDMINQPVRLFRPPYGSQNEQTLSILERNNMSSVLWNRDPQDWRVSSSSQILNYFKETDPSRGIYLLHENALTVEVLPQIIQYLKSQNVEIVILE